MRTPSRCRRRRRAALRWALVSGLVSAIRASPRRRRGESRRSSPSRRTASAAASWHTVRRAAAVGGMVAAVGLAALALDRIGIDQIGHALLAATPVWVLAAFALMCSSMLVRAEAWHAILCAALPERPRAPPRRRPRHDDRRPDVGDLAGPARRAVARADHGAPARPRSRSLPGRARVDRLADPAQHPRAGRARRGDVRDRRDLPRRRGRAGGRDDRAARADPAGDRRPGAATARQAVALRARAAGARASPARRWSRCAAASRSSASRVWAPGRP